MFKPAVNLVILGSVGIDAIETPAEQRKQILGGSASYACTAASFFFPNGMVSIIGDDVPQQHLDIWRHMKIDLQGLQIVDGKTFRWHGVYHKDMDKRDTLFTELNVMKNFSPELPQTYRETSFLFLGNIRPALQLRVLDQVCRPEFILIDTMDIWIHTAKKYLIKAIGRCNMLILNEYESRLLTGQRTSPQAAKELLKLGPEYVLIKKGSHGSMLFTSSDIFLLPAYPLARLKDPTGAGDTFAGGLIGALAASEQIGPEAIREAMVYGTVVASFSVEEFGLERINMLDCQEIESRAAEFREMCRI